MGVSKKLQEVCPSMFLKVTTECVALHTLNLPATKGGPNLSSL